MFELTFNVSQLEEKCAEYQVVDVPIGVSSQLEQLGTKAKFWFTGPDSVPTLFKAERQGSGEHWSEKACCEICRLLGLPHAEYELARYDGTAGVVTPSFVPQGGRLILANELLVHLDENYDENIQYSASSHTVRKAIAVLSWPFVTLPKNWEAPPDIEKPAEVFIGYLMMDALVSNQDRHHENWGMIIASDGSVSLAPTFDHASSLGRNETDSRRHEMLHTKDKNRSVEAYVSRARSALYPEDASTKSLLTLDAFITAARFKPSAANFWVNRLYELNITKLCEILDRIPETEISQLAREFACEMMQKNRLRIIEVFRAHSDV